MLAQWAGGALSYTQKVIALSPIAYWRLNEAAGTTGAGSVLDASGNGRTGTPTAITFGGTGIGDGLTSAGFNGTTSQVSVQGASLTGAFNGQLCTVALFVSVSGAGVWTDATNRELFRFLADGSNYVIGRKTTTNNQIGLFYNAGGTTRTALYTSSGPTGFFPVVCTINKAQDRIRFWTDGTLRASNATLGTFAGSLTTSLIGAGSSPWSGNLAHVSVYASEFGIGDVCVVSNKSGMVIFDGDSRTSGFTTATYAPACMADASLSSKNYGYLAVGVSGQKVSDMNSDFSTEIAPQFRSQLSRNICVAWGGVNDAVASADAATIYSRLQTYWAAARAAGYKVIACTEIDAQSAALNAVNWHSTLYPALNTLIKSDASLYDALADLGADSRLQDATNTTYFNADKLHPVTAGYNVVAGIVASAIAGV